jgi:DNA-directed RNA polymerase beta subunit
MERDCLLSHGSSLFLKERLMDMSDAFEISICSNCGYMPNNLTECNVCNHDNIQKVHIPYACKLLFQDLQALGLKVCINGENN